MLIFILCFVPLSLILTIFILYSFLRLPSEWFQDYVLVDGQNVVTEPNSTVSPSSPFIFVIIFTFTFLSLYFLSFSDRFCNNPLPYIFLLLLLAHISLSDILNMIIPDQHLLGILALGIFTTSKNSFPYQLAGLFTGFLPFFLILALGVLIANVECVGFGDIKLMAALGFFTGPLQILYIYFLSTVLSGLFSILLVVSHFIAARVSSPSGNITDYKMHMFPLGPFICLSCVICMAFL